MAQPSRRAVCLGGVAACATTAFGTVRARAGEGARPSLPIPPELRADAGGVVALDARPGSMRFQAGRETATYGVNGPYLASVRLSTWVNK